MRVVNISADVVFGPVEVSTCSCYSNSHVTEIRVL